MVQFAKKQGLAVTCEATPHHFALTDADITAYDSSYKMKPPLRSECDIAAVIDGIVSGTVDAIATDHAPHPGSEKMQEFEKCPFGIIGLETALALSIEKLYHTRKDFADASGRAVHHRPGAHPGTRTAERSPPAARAT